MSSAKEAILNRIQHALAGIPAEEKPGDTVVPRDYKKEGALDRKEVVDLFAERLGEYKARIRRVSKTEVMKVLEDICTGHQAHHIVIPAGLAKEYIPGSADPVFDLKEKQLSHQQLDKADGVITTCALAVAETGTIILDAGPGQGRRALTLLPDLHICIVLADQVVELVPEAFAYFEEAVKDDRKPVTFISGPSATSDIELSRVEGVHGPRRLEVVIVDS